MAQREPRSACDLMADHVAHGRREIADLERQIRFLEELLAKLQQGRDPDPSVIADVNAQLADVRTRLDEARSAQQVLEEDFAFFCS